MDQIRKTFKLYEIDDKFWEKVILIQIENSSGLGGWGCLWIVTDEPRSYFIGFEGFPYDERQLDGFYPLFTKSSSVGFTYEAEKHGWKYIQNRKILVRNDFYDAFMKVYEEEDRMARRWYGYLHIPDVAAKALKVEKLERYNYEVSDKIIREQWKKY